MWVALSQGLGYQDVREIYEQQHWPLSVSCLQLQCDQLPRVPAASASSTMSGVTSSANLTALESHRGDGPVLMPVGGLTTLIKLTEVRRPVLERGNSDHTN